MVGFSALSVLLAAASYVLTRNTCLSTSYTGLTVRRLPQQIFRKEYFFRGRDNEDQLLRILKVLGTDSFERYLEKYGLYIQTDNRALLLR